VASLAPLTACRQDDSPPDTGSLQQQELTDAIFADSVTELAVRVYYEVGAEPYVGAINSNDTWDITHDSLAALFQNHPGRTLTVPTALADMESIERSGNQFWTYTELLELAGSLNHHFQTGTVVRLPVVIVNGYFGTSADILGLHINGTAVAFIFKGAITNLAGINALQKHYVEQAAIVHYLGRAVGLVNNGVPMVVPHEDPSHPHFAAQADDVMSFQLESASAGLPVILDYAAGNQLVLFGSATLQDGQAYHP
jgi:hypothetical protein